MIGSDADFIYRDSSIEPVEYALFSKDLSSHTASAFGLGTALTLYLSAESPIRVRQLSDRLIQFNIFHQSCKCMD